MTETVATSDWDLYQPSGGAAWDLQRVVHLHRRAGFAAPWPVLERDLRDGPGPAVDRVLAGRSDAADGFEAISQSIGEAATASGSAGRLKAWWLYRMLVTPDPLGERLTLMWHQHFATSNRKVQDLLRMHEQNELFRRHARGPFADLLAAVIQQPAMLVWLDAESNRKGRPNENLARELMELFTLGIGNYTETDVQEAARALTGWTVAGNRCVFRPARHDDGEKQVLGHRGQLDGDDLIGLLIEHPATSRRLAWRLCRAFLGENVVGEPALSSLANGLRSRDLDIGWGVETILRSRLFFSAENVRSRVAGPVEYMVGSLRALELCSPPPSTLMLANRTARMGQDLFYPPNVGGWKDGRGWLASSTIVARANFAAALAEGEIWHPPRSPDLEDLLRRHRGEANLEEAVAWFANLLWGTAPESIVREVAAAAEANDAERRLPAAVTLLLAHPASQLA